MVVQYEAELASPEMTLRAKAKVLAKFQKAELIDDVMKTELAKEGLWDQVHYTIINLYFFCSVFCLVFCSDPRLINQLVCRFCIRVCVRCCIT